MAAPGPLGDRSIGGRRSQPSACGSARDVRVGDGIGSGSE